MKKLLIIVLCLLLLPLLGAGFYVIENVYYEKMGYKAEEETIRYLNKKYDESFEIKENKYSKILGEDNGVYTLIAYPVAKPEISFGIEVSEHYQVLNEDYTSMKWRNEARDEYLAFAEKIFPKLGDMYVNSFFPPEILANYDINDRYQAIYEENPETARDLLHLLLFVEPTFEKEEHYEKIFNLWKIVKGRQLKDYTIEVVFFPRELERKHRTYKDSHQFENDFSKERVLFCRFTKQQIESENINSSNEIGKFCR